MTEVIDTVNKTSVMDRIFNTRLLAVTRMFICKIGLMFLGAIYQTNGETSD